MTLLSFMKAFDKELKEIQKQAVYAERHKSIIECVPKNKTLSQASYKSYTL